MRRSSFSLILSFSSYLFLPLSLLPSLVLSLSFSLCTFFFSFYSSTFCMGESALEYVTVRRNFPRVVEKFLFQSRTRRKSIVFFLLLFSFLMKSNRFFHIPFDVILLVCIEAICHAIIRSIQGIEFSLTLTSKNVFDDNFLFFFNYENTIERLFLTSDKIPTHYLDSV